MATFFVVGSSVPLNTVLPGPTDTYRGGVMVNSLATLNKAIVVAGGEFSNGLRRRDTGSVVYVDATAGLPANTQWANGLPLASNGALCVSTDSASTYSNGIPFAANGAVAVTITA